MPEGDALVGKSVGHYQLARLLGSGGMGAVYLGEHPEIHSRVAIKVLLPCYVEDPHITRRFLDEARAVNRIGHSGVVSIHDCGRQEGIGVYLVMELLEGQTLQEHLSAEGAFSEERTLRLLRQTASALAASHRAGVIHRDLKPSNLFLVPDPDIPGGERVRILDFGIAKLLEQRESATHAATQTGMVMGTLLFMAPEQCLDPKHVDARADIYALGAIGYNLLTGAVPFEAETLGQLVLKQQQGQPKPLRSLRPEVSKRLEAIIHRALAIDPAQRFASMTEFRDALAETLGVAPDSAPPQSAGRTGSASATPPGGAALPDTAAEVAALKARSGRRWWVIGATASLLVAGGLVLGRAVWQRGPSEARVGSSVAAGAGDGGAAPRAGPADAGPVATPEVAVRDSRPPDAAPAPPRSKSRLPRPRLDASPRPPRPRLDASPRPAPPQPPAPGEKAPPRGPHDEPKKEAKKPYFDDL